MRHLRIYESFVRDMEPEVMTPDMDTEVMTPDMERESSPIEMGQFETESTSFTPIDDEKEGDYIVNFVNADGEDTTITIGHAIDPEYVGKTMISAIDMVQDSSSDGRAYSLVGYYDEIPGSAGAYELKKVLIEG